MTGPGRSVHTHLPRHERTTRRGRLKEIRALVHLLGPYRRAAIAGISATFAWCVLSLVPSYLSKVLIDVGIDDGRRGVIIAVAIVSATLVVLMWALVMAQKYYLYDIAARAVVSMQHLLFDHLLRSPPSYHERRAVGDSLSTLTNDVSTSRQLISTGLPTMIRTTTTAAGALILMVVLDWDMAVITLSVLPLLFVVSWVYRRAAAPLFMRLREAIGGVTSSANESLAVVDLIQSYNQQQRHRAAFAEAATENRSAEYRTIVAGAVYFPTTATLTAIANGLLIVYGGTQVVRGNSEVGTMVAFFGYLQMFLVPLTGFSAIFQDYQSGVAALCRVFETVDVGFVASADRGDGRDVVLDDRASGAIALDHLCVRRAGRDDIGPIDATIAAGSLVAFVGDATSGREEIARVVAGLDDPTSGRVVIDGVDGSVIARRSRRRHIGYVSPRTGLFDTTIGENLRMAVPDATPDSLLAALERFYGRAFVDRLPHGLETAVGRDGRNLPSGTRQAIIVARALLRAPKVLVLDAAADSLDADALARLGAARANVLAGVTIVAATNQLLICDYADEVIMLGDGGIVERGSPRDLLAAGGTFADLRRQWRADLGSAPDGSGSSWGRSPRPAR
jgi:ABC-type multidrug transport system fused ATPase/permease subunit